MAYQNNRQFSGRKLSAKRQSWRKHEVSNGVLIDVTPAPGRTYTHATYPPRGRGRGESLTSARRINAKLRACQVIQLRTRGTTWQEIARLTGFRDASGAYRAYKRAIDRLDWDVARRKELKLFG